MRTVHCSGCLLGGVCLGVGGVCSTGGLSREVSAQEGIHLPLWREFLTHACENITFPQLLLRTVIIKYSLSE